MKCNICGSDIKEGSLFCDNCGSVIQMNDSEKKASVNREPYENIEEDNSSGKAVICPHCGFRLPVGSGTCDKCGSVLNITNTNNFERHNGVSWNLTGFISSHKKLLIGIAAIVAFMTLVMIIVLPISQKGIKSGDTGFAVSTKHSSSATSTAEPKSEQEAVPEPDIHQIESILTNNAYHATSAVCVVDLERGMVYSTSNAHQPMSASALTTVPIIYLAEETASNLNKSLSDIQVLFQYSVQGRGIMTQTQNGEVFDMDYLIRNLMAYSDNNITNSLMDYFGLQRIGEICEKNGYRSVEFQRHIGEKIANKDNYISAFDVANMIAELYNSGSWVNKAYLRNNFMIDDSIQYIGLGKPLPSSETFLNHNAFTSEIYNEVCIVPDAKNPYVLAFLSNNGDHTASEAIAAKVSEYVYRIFNK